MALQLLRNRATSSPFNLFSNALRRFSSAEVAKGIPDEARERMMYSDINSQIGSCMPLSSMRIGTIIHNIELNPGQGGKLVRAAGTNAKILKEPTSQYCLVQLPSGVKKLIDSRCRATVGTVSNPTHGDRKLRKAGHSRWLGRRPVVRGVVVFYIFANIQGPKDLLNLYFYGCLLYIIIIILNTSLLVLLLTRPGYIFMFIVCCI